MEPEPQPYGFKGYDSVTRERFFRDFTQGKNLAAATLNRASRATGHRYKARIRNLGHAIAFLPGGGRPLKLSNKAAASIFIIMKARPEFTEAELQGITGEKVSRSTVGREIKRLGMTRKILTRTSTLRREHQQVSYWTNGPLDGETHASFLEN
jgi:transposase